MGKHHAAEAEQVPVGDIEREGDPTKHHQGILEPTVHAVGASAQQRHRAQRDQQKQQAGGILGDIHEIEYCCQQSRFLYLPGIGVAVQANRTQREETDYHGQPGFYQQGISLLRLALENAGSAITQQHHADPG